jgi:hypothetical protein
MFITSYEDEVFLFQVEVSNPLDCPIGGLVDISTSSSLPSG